jgi:hypothetical protein
MKRYWIWTNPKKQGESAVIECNVELNQFKTTYYSPYGLDYKDFFKSLKGAKASMTRYVGYKTEWIEERKSANKNG